MLDKQPGDKPLETSISQIYAKLHQLNNITTNLPTFFDHSEGLRWKSSSFLMCCDTGQRCVKKEVSCCTCAQNNEELKRTEGEGRATWRTWEGQTFAINVVTVREEG